MACLPRHGYHNRFRSGFLNIGASGAPVRYRDISGLGGLLLRSAFGVLWRHGWGLSRGMRFDGGPAAGAGRRCRGRCGRRCGGNDRASPPGPSPAAAPPPHLAATPAGPARRPLEARRRWRRRLFHELRQTRRAPCQGTIAPEGGCPGSFFTSRKWTFEHGALIIRDHKGESLAELSCRRPLRRSPTGGGALSLSR